jgi:hypothetical protein
MTNKLFCKEIKEMSKPVDLLYNWIFHFNPHTELWNAFPREQYTQYWNGGAKDVAKGSTIDKCIKEAARMELGRRKDV